MDSTQYYIRSRGRVQGPFTVEQLRELAKRGRFARHFQVSTDQQEWKQAGKQPDLFPPASPRGAAPPAEPPPVPEALPPEPLADDYSLAPLDDGPRLVPPTDPTPVDLGMGPLDPLADLGPPAGATDEWFVSRNGAEIGPFTFSRLQSLIGTGEVGSDEYVWSDSLPDWSEARSVPGLMGGAGPLLAQHPTAAAANSPLALTSFILGLVAIILPILASIPAIILGHLGLRKIRTSGGRLGGRGLAMTGLILGYVTLIIATLTLVVWLFVLALKGSPAPD